MKRFLAGVLAVCLLGSILPLDNMKASSNIQPQDDRDVTMWGKSWGFLYGNAVIFDEGTVNGRTLIYKDVNANGQIDAEDTPYTLTGVTGDTTEGYDLSNVIFYGLGNSDFPTIYDTHIGDVKITMLGGSIKEINGSMACENTGDFDMLMTGGKIERIMPGVTTKNMKWHGDINVVIGGDAEVTQAVYGASENSDALIDGNINITIQDNAVIGGGSVYPLGVYAGGQQGNNTITGNTRIHVAGGTINGTVSSDLLNVNINGTSSIVIDGGTIENIRGQNSKNSVINNLSVTINDGIFNGSIYNVINGTNANQSSSLNIHGGTFNGQIVNEGKNVTAVKNLDMNITGGIFNNLITLKQNDSAVDPSESGELRISGSPVFKDPGYIMLRSGEFITVPEAITSASGSIRIKAPADTKGTLIAKAKENVVYIDDSKITLTNSKLDLINGLTKEDNHSLYLGSADIQTTISDCDFGTVYLDAPTITNKTVTLKNTGNKAIMIKDLPENEYFSYSFDKLLLYPEESTNLNIHVKKLPAISNSKKQQAFKRTEVVSFENTDFTVEFDILMELIQSGVTKIEISNGWKTESNLEDNVDDLLNEEDKEALKKGSDITFKLFVEDANKTVSNDVKGIAQSYDEIKVGQYLDVYINKYIDTKVTTLTTLPKPIKITIDIPASLLKEGRTFYVLRVHDTKTQIEADMLNDIDQNDKTVTFETDRFSSYVLMYKDKEKDDPIQPIPPVDEPSQPGNEQNTSPSKPDSVDTGDTLNLSIYLAILMTTGGILALILLEKQKGRLNN